MKRGGVGIVEMACLSFAVVVLVASLLPETADPTGTIPAFWSNVFHVLAYLIFATLAALCLAARHVLTQRKLLLVGGFVYAFGIVVECLQPLFGRTFSLVDLGLNAFGILVAIVVLAVSLTIRRRGVQQVSGPAVISGRRN
jgi:VanZ family protein